MAVGHGTWHEEESRSRPENVTVMNVRFLKSFCELNGCNINSPLFKSGSCFHVYLTLVSETGFDMVTSSETEDLRYHGCWPWYLV